jgi:hypothetical protein
VLLEPTERAALRIEHIQNAFEVSGGDLH